MQGFVFRYLKYNESWSLDFYFFLHIVFVPPNIYTTEVVISENLVGHFSVTRLAVLVKKLLILLTFSLMVVALGFHIQ